MRIRLVWSFPFSVCSLRVLIGIQIRPRSALKLNFRPPSKMKNLQPLLDRRRVIRTPTVGQYSMLVNSTP